MLSFSVLFFFLVVLDLDVFDGVCRADDVFKEVVDFVGSVEELAVHIVMALDELLDSGPLGPEEVFWDVH